MKATLLLFGLILISLNAITQKTFHDFKVEDIEGRDFDLASLEGKKVLVVNTASKCGFTPQYEDLQKLYEEYGGEDFTVIGFPANNFLGKEPGSNEEIRAFCSANYGISFPMMAKISVKGKDMHPVYRWLTSKKENGKMNSSVKWNFQKYMINPDGSLDGKASTITKPFGPAILEWIKRE